MDRIVFNQQDRNRIVGRIAHGSLSFDDESFWGRRRDEHLHRRRLLAAGLPLSDEQSEMRRATYVCQPPSTFSEMAPTVLINSDARPRMCPFADGQERRDSNGMIIFL